MKIVVDENIPLAEQSFGALGDVVLVAGRQLQAADLRDADALIVRSVTQVNEHLLKGTPVGFVGSATIGVDHIDQHYLRQNNIAFASAPGCNGRSVAEFVITALLELESIREFDLAGKSVGIIGVGNVGSALQSLCEPLGLTVLPCDPPRQARGVSGLVSEEEAWQADIVTLHVPYEEKGRFATRHLGDASRLNALVEGAVLINTARGAVVDNMALSRVLDSRYDLSVVLDVWEGEPFINRQLANQVDIATPHIAGYSYDGKVKGTWMILEALCRYLNTEPPLRYNNLIDDKLNVVLDFSDRQIETPQRAIEIIQRVYDMREDDIGLRTSMQLPREKRALGFDALRKSYRVRRECSTVVLRGAGYLKSVLSEQQFNRVCAMGFQLIE
ncbi:4-phosphoerythronate dehydrogenase [Ketobacter sp. MCCC 1A13808]|uniref:4-phosphoerythronate dehydrogenase n=1 Tax=Ketobacter sp. MCCC 1A13808 TaxID=2602738 RepID=UPI0012EC6E4B|nr:4-phosphoerythronate dehydrogenase [Ketobacter sp. MCCC 1A13808]MVF12638.1 4-phosphoerythronate dehydrogenase [Ketobacter sp. MCCC 1A13808]